MTHGLCQDLREHSQSDDEIYSQRGEALELSEQNPLLVGRKGIGEPNGNSFEME